jgi:hypothetical protein
VIRVKEMQTEGEIKAEGKGKEVLNNIVSSLIFLMYRVGLEA